MERDDVNEQQIIWNRADLECFQQFEQVNENIISF